MNTDKRSQIYSLIVLIIKIMMMVSAVYMLHFSDSFYSPHLCIFVIAVLISIRNYTDKTILPERFEMLLIRIWALLLTLMIVLANYPLWASVEIIGLVKCAVLLTGCYFAWSSILLWCASKGIGLYWRKADRVWKPQIVLVVVFCLVVIIDLIVLFLCKYPGILSPDSFNQINQTLTGKYSNHHPVWHTFTIKACMTVGKVLFHNINAMVATYSCFSIVLMAATFAFSIATMAELHISKKILILLVVFYVGMPYHIMYSITMWKDVFYGAFTLLFSVFFFRYMENLSYKKLNYYGVIISGIGICLWRSNGLIVFVSTVIVYIVIWNLHCKKMLITLFSIVIVSFILKQPVLKALNIPQPDPVEALSIPVQQVARDVIENEDLSEQQSWLLGQIIEVEKIPETYISFISDPIKNLIREKNNQEFLKKHARDYAAFYITRIIRHPSSYIEAWIDQTRGYWDGGYLFKYWGGEIPLNEFGIHRVTNSETLDVLLNKYLSTYLKNPVLQLFVSIGLFDWLLLIILFAAILKHDKTGVMLITPVIMNVGTLLIAAPVFSDMRYNYPVFCTLPIITVLVLRPNEFDSDRISIKNKSEDRNLSVERLGKLC